MPSPAMQTAAALRFPVWPRDDKEPSAREKIETLEDHVCVTTYWLGELHQERLELYEQLDEFKREWDHLEGWERYKRTKTEAAVEDAKRQLRPDLYDALKDTRAEIDRLTDEIKRLDRDYDKASRVYTMLTGS